jgi:hypothetical protein
MMSDPSLDLTLLISQLPHLQQAMGPQHMPAEAQQAIFGQLVAENQRKEDQTVQVVDKEEGLKAMDRETGGNKDPGSHAQQRSANRRPPPPAEDQAAATQSSNASPWTGNIINVKI